MIAPVALHTARWVLPVTSEPIEYGCVAVFEGSIVGVGKAHEMRQRFPSSVENRHEDAVIMPSFINAHCHLELSPLKWRITPTGSFSFWLSLMTRARENIDKDEVASSIQQAADELVRGGALIIGDVGNTMIVPSVIKGLKDGWPLRGIHFFEIINPEDSPDIVDSILSEPFLCDGDMVMMDIGISAHSAHTVGKDTLCAIKKASQESAMPFTLHIAESDEEIEFLTEGTGPMVNIMRERGRDMTKIAPPMKGPVSYLDGLGLLDRLTMLVHCVKVTEKDLDTIRDRGTSICLCMRSNTFLGVGEPPVDKMIARKINCAIGTDSLASNDRLDIFSEMSSIKRAFPHISPVALVNMATMGGAYALGLDKFFGSLENSKRTPLISISLKEQPASASELYELIALQGSKEEFDIDIIW